MRLGIIGIKEETAANIALNLHVRWLDLEVVYPKSATEFRELDLVIIGDNLLPLREQVRAVRDVWDGVVIAFTSAASDQELVVTLGEGADDYISLSASGPEIVSRASAALRRSRSSEVKNESVRAGSLCINPDTFEAFLGDDSIFLTPTEFRLLYHLMRNKGRVLTHQALQELTWGSEGPFYRGALRKYIQRLRSKLYPFEDSVNIISIPRVGYRLDESIQPVT